MSLSLWVFRTLNPMLCRVIFPKLYRVFFGLSILFELYWAYTVIFGAFVASGSEYVVSYGQVQPPLLFGGRVYIERLHIQLLPLFAAAYTLLSTVKLGYTRCWDLVQFFRCLPERMWWAIASARSSVTAPAKRSTPV